MILPIFLFFTSMEGILQDKTDKSVDERILDAVFKAIGSPRSYSLDGEAIENLSPDELARLISMARRLKAESSPTGARTPFRIFVQNCNTTYDE